MSLATDPKSAGELYCTTCEKAFDVGERCPADGTRLIKLRARVDPFLGRDLDGRYTVVEKLGQGGMGAVYRGEQHSVGRQVAIKVINTSLVSDPEVIKRFLREAKLASKLAHPNAVAVLDFGQTDDGVFYLVMELVSGRTLDAAIKAERVFRPERVVRIGTQICDALDGAHALSIIHRDLKPSNVMLLSQGRDLVKVLDFGLAKSMSPDATSTTMTGTGAIVGTPAFMPPELATGVPCDGRADLYSLGCILYLLGSGRLPFTSESVHELVAMHGSADRAPPMPGVPPRLAAVIGKLLEKDPRDRFQTAAEALQALEMSVIATTPAMGVSQWSGDSSPSMLATAAGKPRAHSSTDMQRMISGATMLATDVSPSAAVSQPGLPAVSNVAPPRRSRWPLLAIAGGLAIALVVTLLLARGGGTDQRADHPRSAAPQTMPAVETSPTVETKPAVDTQPAVESKPAVETQHTIGTEPAVETKPAGPSTIPKRPRATKPPKVIPTTNTATTKPVTPIKPAVPPTTTKPATGSPGPKPPVLPF